MGISDRVYEESVQKAVIEDLHEKAMDSFDKVFDCVKHKTIIPNDIIAGLVFINKGAERFVEFLKKNGYEPRSGAWIRNVR